MPEDDFLLNAKNPATADPIAPGPLAVVKPSSALATTGAADPVSFFRKPLTWAAFAALALVVYWLFATPKKKTARRKVKR